VVFTASHTNGGTTPTYQWKLNGNNITGANSATYSTTTLANIDVITVLMGSSLTSCVTGTPATSNSITTTVTSIPATPGVISGLTTICLNSNQVYSVAAVTGATSYTWIVTGNISASISSTTNVLNITSANVQGAGTLEVFANNACGISLGSASLSITVNNTPAPTAGFTISPSAGIVCSSSPTVTFTNTSSPNAGSTLSAYNWDFGDGSSQVTTQNASRTYTASGIYDVVMNVTSSNNCTSSFSSRITVDPISVAGTASAAASSICEGSNTILTLTGNTGLIQWQSSTDGINFNNITGATSASLNTGNLTTTTYYQAVVTSGSCSAATSGVLTVTVSPTPLVTLSPVANVYATTTSFDLIYNNAVGAPDEYSISSVAPNSLPNFNTITNFGLIGSPITVAIPASVTGTYNFNLTVKNGALGCTSTVIPFTVTVVPDPPANLTYNTPNVYNVGNTITPLNPTSSGGPITQYTIGPSLPAGLTIDPTTGIISGTPSAVSTQTSYTVTGTNASGTVTATVVITVNVAAPASLSYTTPNVYTTGTNITSLNPTTTGGPISQYSIGPSLPAGLSIDPATGIISGTPTVASPQTTYVVTGTNVSGTITTTVVITVNSSVVPQPQGSLEAVDYGLLAADTVKLKLTTSNGTAPFTLILSNSVNTTKDTISNLTPTNNVVEFLQKRLDTTKVFTIFKLTDANNNARTSGFTKDTTIVRVLKPQILLTLKADPAVKQADNSFKTRLLLKIKNAGQLNLRNVQVNANLSTVFPTGITYVLDSVRVLSGGLVLNPNYSGAGSATSATSASSADWIASASNNGSTKSFAVLDGNYLFNSGVNLNQSEEGEVAYYVSIGATTQNVVLKLQFETAGDGVLVKNDGSSSAQQTTSISDDGTNINQHPDLIKDGVPLPTYVPLFPNEKIGASLNVGSATPVTGGYQFHFTAKVKNYGNVNLDSIRIQYNFNEIFPAPDQAVLVSNPTVTRGNLVYNVNNYNGYSNVNLFDYGGDLQVGDSATYEYDLKVTTARTAYTWQNYFVAYGRSVNSGQFISDTSMAGVDPDPNKDNDPIEKFLTGVTINYERPAPPTVDNKTYNYGDTKPANIGGLVKSTPTGTIPVWCDTKTAACSVTPPPTPTEIGKYIYALRSYDTTTLLYSEVLVYDTVIIKPPVPVVVNKKYIIGANTNPNNVAGQVTGMAGSTLNYFKNAGLLSSIPTLGVVPGVTRYTTSQTVNAIESDTVGFTVTMLDPKTMLHLQKIAEEPRLQTNSTFNITYTFLVNNRTDEPMSNVLVVDNLQNTFPQPTAFTKVSLSSTGGLVTNNGFNGMSDLNLLNGSSTLAAFAIDTIRLTVNLQPKGYTGTVNNTAVIAATTPYGVINMNSSSQAFANETAKTPTPSVIPDLTIDIPEAFSPNRDGVNDRFVILKPFGTTLELEVFNRWGNVVYANGNYNNEWDGRGTNNFIGQDLMDGGYYYTLKAKSVNGNIQIFKGFVLIQR
jgi:gliding motility-associated-like protein